MLPNRRSTPRRSHLGSGAQRRPVGRGDADLAGQDDRVGGIGRHPQPLERGIGAPGAGERSHRQAGGHAGSTPRSISDRHRARRSARAHRPAGPGPPPTTRAGGRRRRPPAGRCPIPLHLRHHRTRSRTRRRVRRHDQRRVVLAPRRASLRALRPGVLSSLWSRLSTV
jgi:hypothetical protein